MLEPQIRHRIVPTNPHEFSRIGFGELLFSVLLFQTFVSIREDSWTTVFYVGIQVEQSIVSSLK